MTALPAIIITVGVVVALTVWFFVLRLRHVHARLTPEGFQELEIVVKGRYHPDFVVVRRGIPVRLNFRREEDTRCSERVIFSDFHTGSHLPAHQTTSLSFVPTRCGDFMFTCEFGMYLGRLVVVEPSRRGLARMRWVASGKTGDRLPRPANGTSTSLGFVSGPIDHGRQEKDNV
ncbi:MAG: cupredoxin domain-containing protein [Chloroflexi bacterium]|nr:cupredoxin domain-containing protein [Chloroflexota bacterium]